MTLDEIERLALEVTKAAACCNSVPLADAVLAMLPVVRAAGRMRDTWASAAQLRDGVGFEEEVALAREFMKALDAMRAAMESK